MSKKRDYYEILGVSQNASDKELKAAYRKLAMQYHPDRNDGDKQAESKFKEVNEAYAILSDHEKRSNYDQFGHADMQNDMHGGQQAQGFHDFSDIFNQVFGDVFGDTFGRTASGGGRQQTTASRGEDLKYELDITLNEAFHGKKVDFKYPVNETCSLCKGSGAAEGAKPVTCSTCQGRGRLRRTQGFFTLEQTCPSCRGRGQRIENPCRKCSGSGIERIKKHISIEIPKGIEDGTPIRLSNKGNSGEYGGTPGDLYVFISVRKHNLFERKGANLYCQAPVPMTIAALGGYIEIPTINEGNLRVKVRPGTQTGKKMRLNGQGMPYLNRTIRGDLILELCVETPVKLNEKQKELLQKFSEKTDANSHPESSGFFNKVKHFFNNE